MPSDKNKIELIKKFLNEEIVESKDLKRIQDVLDLPISAFKFILDKDEQLIKALFQATKIGELGTLDELNPLKKLSKTKKSKLEKDIEKNLEFEERLKKAITISLIIQRMRFEDIEEKEKKQQKIVVLGLQNAGKTAILKALGGKMGIKDLKSLKPTKGLKRQEINTKDLKLVIADFGGQKSYRNKYLSSPEKYFFQSDLVIFVLDILASDKYDEAIEFLDNIMTILLKLEENPYVLIYLHKFDPDVRENTDVLLNVELLKTLIKSIFNDKPQINYEMYLSSIFTMLSNEPQFSKFLKDVMASELMIADSDETPTERIKALEGLIEKALDGVVKLSETVMKQYAGLENRIRLLEVEKVSAPSTPGAATPPHAPSAPPPGLIPPPPPIASSMHKPAPRGTGVSARASIVNELKNMFAKRRALNLDL